MLALIVGTKRGIRRKDGSVFYSDSNKILLVTQAYVVLGTRIYGFVPRELRLNKNKFGSITNMAKAAI
jgi:large subunit ribosomal protein L14